jgi:1,4-dihydroxy-2-naphthoyl-CoA hydrolase
VALPVVHCQADFLAPLVVGDPLAIQLEPRRLDPGSFELQYCFLKEQQPAARALSRHLAIDSASRRRCPLPPAINRWLEASAIGQGIQPVQEPVAHRLSGDSENRSGALP